ncbi:MAG: hypothetical protein KDK64_06660, partial [Chlamydiia bacterium]|nr:hypothetical protein [Chlamydiia bacterium]
MNRRDIIIIAVLINAGLLVTLFVSSLKKEQNVDLAYSSSGIPQVEIAAVPPKKKKKDQVD